MIHFSLTDVHYSFKKKKILARQCDTGADPVLPCADPESFVRGGLTLATFIYFFIF